MTGPKPLEEGCTGGIFCPIDKHIKLRANGTRRSVLSHIPLTVGQRKQLQERRAAERAAFDATHPIIPIEETP